MGIQFLIPVKGANISVPLLICLLVFQLNLCLLCLFLPLIYLQFYLILQFSSHYRLASWAGLAPGCNESAGKKKSVKISRAGVYLKPALVEVAHSAVKDKDNPYYANKFNVLSKRRGKKRACIAIARKILVAIYHMLSTGELFNPTDASKVETSDKDKIQFLGVRGYYAFFLLFWFYFYIYFFQTNHQKEFKEKKFKEWYKRSRELKDKYTDNDFDNFKREIKKLSDIYWNTKL